MVKVMCGETEIYLDGYLKENLDLLRLKVQKKWDGVSLWVGEEGDGKTTAALQAAMYLDPTLRLDRIVFDADGFEQAVLNSKPFQAIVWDEADELGGHWANKMVMAIKRLMKRIRKKQLYIFLVTPTMFDLGKYFVVHRTKFVVHIYSKGLERGFLRFFAGEKKTMLYMQGYKMWNMYACTPNFVGSFSDLPKDWPIDMVAYEKKKDDATADQADGMSKLINIFGRLDEHKKLSRQELAYGFNVHIDTITAWRAKIRSKLPDVPDFEVVGNDNTSPYFGEKNEEKKEEEIDSNGTI